MRKSLLFYFLSSLLLTGCAVNDGTNTTDGSYSQTIQQLKTDIQSKHPVTYLELAGQLFSADKKDEAVSWYYIGQIRYRAYLMANPEIDPSGDPALYGA